MKPAIPLDDLIGQTHYIDGALWRYLYDRRIDRFALKRTVVGFPLDHALELIASGEILWSPPDRIERPRADLPMRVVQERVALMEAFKKSPTYVDSTDWTMHALLDEQLVILRTWLTLRALTSGGATDNAIDGAP
jgi:hypothetical protein